MARICFEDVTRHYAGADEPAVVDVRLEVDDGETVALVGPPGAGKTTLLRLAGGLEVPDRGKVRIERGPRELDAEGPVEVVLVFQNYAIYPNLSVRENVASPLQAAGRRDDARVDEVVELLGLADSLRRPASSLSASERMRVALARSFVRRPGLLLMDEPLANLAPAVHADLRDRLVAAQQTFRVTTLYATEDLAEAEAVADRVVRVEAGRVG